MIAFYGAGVIAQAALGEVTGWGETAPFMVAGMLATLSVLPIVILPRVSPLLDQVEPLKPRQLLGVAPTGLVGCFGSGSPSPGSMPCCRCTCNASAWTSARPAT